METARVFTNGNSQAVRLPKAYRFQGDKVFVRRVGDGLLLLPCSDGWDSLLASLTMFTDDFMEERQQPPDQVRDLVFP